MRNSSKQKYVMMVFSNPTANQEETYLKWYEGQHVHDLLRIPGFVGAQFYKIADSQQSDAPDMRYLMIWEIETDDLAAVFEDVNARMKDGRTVMNEAFDMNYVSISMFPITKYITSDEIKGKSVEEVLAISTEEIVFIPRSESRRHASG